MGFIQLLNELILSQIKKPSCIDLIFSDQLDPVIENGIESSTDNLCNHQILMSNFLQKWALNYPQP